MLKKCKQLYQAKLLNFYRKMGRHGEMLEYRLVDPEGYEADVLLRDLCKGTKVILKKLEKGKNLSDREKRILKGAKLSVRAMKERNLGRQVQLREELSQHLDFLLPEGETVEELLVGLQAVLSSMGGGGTPC